MGILARAADPCTCMVPPSLRRIKHAIFENTLALLAKPLLEYYSMSYYSMQQLLLFLNNIDKR